MMHDVIVIGTGSMGISACYYLAKQGVKVLGIDQFSIPHDLGSHAGQSRIIRKAYFEHPDYVPLLDKAYANWKEIETVSNTTIYYKTGLVYYAKPGHALMSGLYASAKKYGIPIENFSSEQYPQFQVPADFESVIEPDAGFITPEKAIISYAEQAIRLGAVLKMNEKVLEWKKEDNCIKVSTINDTYLAKKLVITSGPWAAKMIPGLVVKLRVTRQPVAWIQPKKWDNYTLNNFPCWMIEDEQKPGVFYGFPLLQAPQFGGPAGLKMAHHTSGTAVDPDQVNRIVTETEKNDLLYILEKYLPGCFDSFLTLKTCLYTYTPDEHFIIDLLPGFEDSVSVACGFSGHGFKFVSVVGEILADLALKGATEMPIDFLSLKRFI